MYRATSAVHPSLSNETRELVKEMGRAEALVFYLVFSEGFVGSSTIQFTFYWRLPVLFPKVLGANMSQLDSPCSAVSFPM